MEETNRGPEQISLQQARIIVWLAVRTDYVCQASEDTARNFGFACLLASHTSSGEGGVGELVR